MAPCFSDRLRLGAEEGFGIIEVLVSAILVVIVSTGVFAAFDGATRASGTNKARSVAANVARTDQERLRGLTAQALASLPVSSTQPVDGKDFTIASTTEWVADRTGTPTCTSADGRADYLKMRSSVTWPGIGPLKPVVIESLRAIPRGAFRPNQGSISVKVTDRNGAAVSGASVSITGNQAYSGTTNALGCVLIDQVPVGSYSASITKSGYVTDKYPNDAAFVKAFTVAKEETSTVPATLDSAGTAAVTFKSTSSVGGAETGTGIAGEGFTIANTGLINPTERNHLLAGATAPVATLYSGNATTALTANTTRNVFPFTSAYKVWAGACDEANPANWTPRAGQPIPNPVPIQTVAPGALATAVSVREPLMSINVRKYTTSTQVSTSTSNVSTQRVTITPVVSACARTPAPLTTNTSGVVNQSMPYGQYTICAQDSTSTTSARRLRVLRVNGTAAGTAFTVLYNGNVTAPADGAIILPYSASASAAC